MWGRKFTPDSLSGCSLSLGAIWLSKGNRKELLQANVPGVSTGSICGRGAVGLILRPPSGLHPFFAFRRGAHETVPLGNPVTSMMSIHKITPTDGVEDGA
jgi:hypothetical protein